MSPPPFTLKSPREDAVNNEFSTTFLAFDEGEIDDGVDVMIGRDDFDELLELIGDAMTSGCCCCSPVTSGRAAPETAAADAAAVTSGGGGGGGVGDLDDSLMAESGEEGEELLSPIIMTEFGLK